MVLLYCCVPNCYQSNASGIQLFRIPKENESPYMRSRWLKSINRPKNLPERSFVCEKHFTQDQIKNLDEGTGKRVLFWDAVPKVFNCESNLETSLKTFIIYPNKTTNTNSCDDPSIGQVDILADLETPPEILEVQNTSHLESNVTSVDGYLTDENSDTNDYPFLKVVPFKELQMEPISPEIRMSPNLVTLNHISQQKNHTERSNEQKSDAETPILTIDIDSSDEDELELVQAQTPIAPILQSVSRVKSNSQLFRSPNILNGLLTDVPDKIIVRHTSPTISYRDPKNPEIQKLERELQMARRRVSILTSELHNLESRLKKVFSYDQLYMLKHGRMQGCKWRGKTIKKALQLYFSCGQLGYKNIKAQHYPLPSMKKLQKYIKQYDTRSGLLDDVIPMLNTDIESVKPEERQALMLIDGLISNHFAEESQ